MKSIDESVLVGVTRVIRGRIRSSASNWTQGQIWVGGEKIIAVENSQTEVPAGVKLDDYGESYIIPGGVDAHVHSLSHENEGFIASTSAASAGGITTIVEMPFDSTGPTNTRDRFMAKKELANSEARVDVALLGTLAPQGGWREMENLLDVGAKGFKVSLFLTDERRFPRIDDYELLNVMAAASANQTTICVHAENNEIIQGLLLEERQSGRRDDRAHPRTRPPISESLGVLTAMEVAYERGAKLHLCHISGERPIQLLGWYRDQGADISAETCPHYLTFVEDDLDWAHGKLKINPPIRQHRDRESLWRGIEEQLIEVISSDHAPWPVSLKSEEYILDNLSGIPGVQTVMPMSLGNAFRRGGEVLMTKTLDSLTIGPARRYGLDGIKGSLDIGKDADITVFTLTEDYMLQLADMYSNAGFTPYEGHMPGGRIDATYVRGTPVFSNQELVQWKEGQGRVL